MAGWGDVGGGGHRWMAGGGGGGGTRNAMEGCRGS